MTNTEPAVNGCDLDVHDLGKEDYDVFITATNRLVLYGEILEVFGILYLSLAVRYIHLFV